jgi:hypothetical protein
VSRRPILLAAGAAIVILAAVLVVVFRGSGPVTHRPVSARAATAPGSVPRAADSAVRLLVSTQGRTALTPELNSALPVGRLFPASTTFTTTPGSWHQTAAYANVSGILRLPGHPPEHAEIGLVRRSGRWLVTFEAKK